METEASTTAELVVSAVVVAVETPMAGWLIKRLAVLSVYIFSRQVGP